jgi:hypothetical protein
MRIDIEVVRSFLEKQQQHITHYMVAHSYYRTYEKELDDLERMAEKLKKHFRYARNCFNRELYGNGPKRKPLLYQPLLIATIEGASKKNIIDPAQTLHYNIYLGNIPKQLTDDDIKELWKYCWHTKAGQSDDIFITTPQNNTQSHLLRYGTKEGQLGSISCWDFENTQIPYDAFNAD